MFDTNCFIQDSDLPLFGSYYARALTYNGHIFVHPGWTQAVGDRGRLASARVIGRDVGAWNVNAGNIPSPTYAAEFVRFGNTAYILGGADFTTGKTCTDVWAANFSGPTLSRFQRIGDMPESFGFFGACAASNGYMYLTGGWDPGPIVHDRVYYAKIGPKQFGKWVSSPALPTPTFGHTAFEYAGYLWIVGIDGGSAPYSSNVYSARLNGDGSLGAWKVAGALPDVRRSAVSAAYNGFLVVAGGRDAAGTTLTSLITARMSQDGRIYNGQNHPMALPVQTRLGSATIIDTSMVVINGRTGLGGADDFALGTWVLSLT